MKMRELLNGIQIAELDAWVVLDHAAFNEIQMGILLTTVNTSEPDAALRLRHLMLLHAEIERAVRHYFTLEPDSPLKPNLLAMARHKFDEFGEYKAIYQGVINGDYDDIAIDWDGDPIVSDSENSDSDDSELTLTIPEQKNEEGETDDDEASLSRWGWSP